MKSLIQGVRCFWSDEEGANGIEYALLAALIAVAFITGATLLGDNLNVFFNKLGTCISTLTPAACAF
jgi:pilus assembly protein Flp/PilA